jgi:hypothetical protein
MQTDPNAPKTTTTKIKGLPAMDLAIQSGLPVIQQPGFWKKRAQLQRQEKEKAVTTEKKKGT